MLPDELLLKIMQFLNIEDAINLSSVNKRLYNISHDRQLWKVFCLSTDPYRNKSVCNIIAKHCLHFEKLQYENRRGTLWNYFQLACIQCQLMLCKNLTEIILTNNLMIQSLQFVNAMPKLRTINISGCNLLSSYELQYLYGHPSLKVVHLNNFYEMRQDSCLFFVVQLPHRVKIEELDIERSTYITPNIGESIIIGSCLKVLRFTPKWKRPQAWKNFNDKFVNVEFGLDFKTVLDFSMSGIRSSRLQQLYNAAPFWATYDSDDSEDDGN